MFASSVCVSKKIKDKREIHDIRQKKSIFLFCNSHFVEKAFKNIFFVDKVIK